MEQLDEALNRLLNDPGAMEQVMHLAQSLGGTPVSQPGPPEAGTPDLPKLLSTLQTDDRQTALLRALGAYLSPKRREKLERALQLARLSGLMKHALQQNDPDDGRLI